MKRLFFYSFFIFFSINLTAQVVGSRENGDIPIGTTVESAKLTEGGISSDVNLFNGDYTSSYSLGSVSTPGGISFDLTLSHSNSYSTGNTVPVSSGIPYGEGWNLNIPTVMVTTDAYNKFTAGQECNILDQNHGGSGSDRYMYYSANERLEEGDVFWFSPYINIPGVVSGRAVFKQVDNESFSSIGDELVFVMNGFEDYVEVRFSGNTFKVILPDGLTYVFNVVKSNYRGASNRRVLSNNQITSAIEGGELNDVGVETQYLKNVLLPKEDYNIWYCKEIYNLNEPSYQQIHFEYEKFGAFNYYKEYQQFLFSESLNQQLAISSLEVDFRPDFTAYTDVLLKRVYSLTGINTELEVLELDYESVDASVMNKTSDLLNFRDADVFRKDSLYSFSTVYSEGTDSNFEDWVRYNHLRSDNAYGLENQIDFVPGSNNPYLGTKNSEIGYLIEELNDAASLSFNHGYLESPRVLELGIGTPVLIPGDIYEIKTEITNGNSSFNDQSTKYLGTIDINLTTFNYDVSNLLYGTDPTLGSHPDTPVHSLSGGHDFVRQDIVDETRGSSIFSTFGQAVKWSTHGKNENTANQGRIETSNYFLMPNIPENFNGFNIQVGPGNSDTKYTFDQINDAAGTFLFQDGTKKFPSAYGMYFPYIDNPYRNQDNILSGDPVHAHFGIGMPWSITNHLYYNWGEAEPNHYKDHSYRFWWKSLMDLNKSAFFDANEPTLLDGDVHLKKVELVRYAKNPYMLKRVKKYRYNGEVAYHLPGEDIEGKHLIQETELVHDVYQAKSVQLTSSSFTYERPLNLFILKEIKQIPVDPSQYLTNLRNGEADDVQIIPTKQEVVAPTVKFDYALFSDAKTQADEIASKINTLGSFLTIDPFYIFKDAIVLSKVVNIVGGETNLEYSGNLAQNTYSSNFRCDQTYSALNPLRQRVAEIIPTVKSVTFVDPTTQLPKETRYEFSKPAYKNLSFKLNENFKGANVRSFNAGYNTTKVLLPELESGKRNTNIYKHYGTFIDERFIDQISYVEYYWLYFQTDPILEISYGDIIRRIIEDKGLVSSTATYNASNYKEVLTQTEIDAVINDPDIQEVVSIFMAITQFYDEFINGVSPATLFDYNESFISNGTHSEQENYLMFGKVFKVDKLDDDNNPLEVDEIKYEASLAYENGMFRLNPYASSDSEYNDYETGQGLACCEPSSSEKLVRFSVNGDLAGEGDIINVELLLVSLTDGEEVYKEFRDDVAVGVKNQVEVDFGDSEYAVFGNYNLLDWSKKYNIHVKAYRKSDGETLAVVGFLYNSDKTLTDFDKELVSEGIEQPRYLGYNFFDILSNNHPDYVLNSFFIKKTQEKNTKFEKGLFKKGPGKDLPDFPDAPGNLPLLEGELLIENPNGDGHINSVSPNDLIQVKSIIESPTLNNDDKANQLISISPLSDLSLIEVLNQIDVLTSDNVVKVLAAQNRLSDEVLDFILRSGQMGNSDKEQLLLQQPYLTDKILTSCLEECPELEDLHVKSTMLDQSRVNEMVLTRVLHHNMLSDNTVRDVFNVQPHRMSENLMVDVLERLPKFNEQIIHELYTRQDQITDNVTMKLMEREPKISGNTLFDILMTSDIYPSDETLIAIINDQRLSPPQMNDLLEASPRVISNEVEQALSGVNKYRVVLGDIPGLRDRQKEDNLSQFCKNKTEIRNYQIITVKDYEYFEASFDGTTTAKGYQELFNTTEQIQLSYSPSWQLYSVKEYSLNNPDAFSKTEYFYLYDLLNFNQFFDVGGLVGNYQLRHLPYQKRVTTKKSVSEKPLVRSEYYIYQENNYSANDERVRSEESVELIAGEDCPDFSPDDDEPETEEDKLLELLNQYGEVPDFKIIGTTEEYHDEIQDNLAFGTCLIYVDQSIHDIGQTFWIVEEKTISLFTSNYDGVTSVVCNTVINQPFGVPQKNTTTYPPVIELFETYVQVDTLINDDYNGENGLLNLSASGSAKFPFDVLRTRQVADRNAYGQPELEMDVDGLYTRYYYDIVVSTFTEYTDCEVLTTFVNDVPNIGMPYMITRGWDLQDSLTTQFEYYPNNKLKKVIHPNDITYEYRYDELDRLIAVEENDRLLTKNIYSLWDRDENKSFSERAKENYVDTYTFNDEGDDQTAEQSRQYIDPLGRNYNSIWLINNNSDVAGTDQEISTFSTTINSSGEFERDTWDRDVALYKPFSYTVAGGELSPLLNTDVNAGNVPTGGTLVSTNASDFTNQFAYENNQKSRVLRTAKMGLDIASDNTVRNEYCYLNYIQFVCELGLEKEEYDLYLRGTDRNAYRFLRVQTQDEDDKVAFEYYNTIGQKIANRNIISGDEEVVTLFGYDDYHNLNLVINPKKQTSAYKYNILGWMYQKDAVDEGRTKHMYNKRGQVVLSQDNNGGASISSPDANDITYYRIFEYDDFGRPLSQSKIRPVRVNTSNGNSDVTLEYRNINFFSDKSFSISKRMTNASTMSWLAKATVNGSDLLVFDNGLIPEQTIFEKEWAYHSTSGKALGKLHQTKDYNNEIEFADFASGTVTQTPVNIEDYTYDDEGRVLKVEKRFNANGIDNTTDLTSTVHYPAYNLRGSMLVEEIDVKNNGTADIQYRHEYDGYNRLKAIYVKLNNQLTEQKIVEYSYDDALHLLTNKKLFVDDPTGVSHLVDQTNLSYDERDRLTSMSCNFYTNNLFYDNQSPIGFSVNHDDNFNGNMNATTHNYNLSLMENYITGDGFDTPTVYGFMYDGVNRLIGADNYSAGAPAQAQNSSAGDALFEYDVIGNITHLKRQLSVSQFEEFDYSIGSTNNRLNQVRGIGGTQDRNYTYDANGNLLTDDFRSINTTNYGRANYAYTLDLGGTEVNYLYNVNDQRIYKEEKALGTTLNEEYYLSNAMGQTCGILDVQSDEWTWYVNGHDRVAKITPTQDQQPANNRPPQTGGLTPTDAIYAAPATATYFGLKQLIQKAEHQKPKNVIDRIVNELIPIAGGLITAKASQLIVNNVVPNGDEETQAQQQTTNDPEQLQVSYYVNDYLGNTRLVYTPMAVEDQSNPGTFNLEYTLQTAMDYYPYGKVLRHFGNNEKYLTTQHERDTETDYDYRGARYSESTVPRFHSVDPLASQYPSWSPYNYVMGNPVRYIDPTGMGVETDYYDKQTGEHIKHVDDGIDEAVAIDRSAFNSMEEQGILSNQTSKIWGGESLGTQTEFAEFKAAYDQDVALSGQSGLGGSAVGFALAYQASIRYNSNTWIGKNGITYSHSFHGNQYTGGRLSYARNLSRGLKVGGGLLSAYQLASTYNDWQSGQMTDGQAFESGLVGTIGAMGPYGALFNLTYSGMYELQNLLGRSLRAKTFWQPLNPEPEVEIRK